MLIATAIGGGAVVYVIASLYPSAEIKPVTKQHSSLVSQKEGGDKGSDFDEAIKDADEPSSSDREDAKEADVTLSNFWRKPGIIAAFIMLTASLWTARYAHSLKQSTQQRAKRSRSRRPPAPAPLTVAATS